MLEEIVLNVLKEVCVTEYVIAPCSIVHGNIDYCFKCEEYPYRKYDGINQKDSLMMHKNQLKDMDKAQRIGIKEYHNQQRQKVKILHKLLNQYNMGDDDVFYCLSVNLLELNDLRRY